MRPAIFDTGPLVAWLCPRDVHHPWAREVFTKIRAPGIVCEAVLAEVCHLAVKEGIPRGRVMDFVMGGGLQVVSIGGEVRSIRDLLDRYADTPMDFADACVTRLAELHSGFAVCTTDSDFVVFRKNRDEPIPLIAPFCESN